MVERYYSGSRSLRADSRWCRSDRRKRARNPEYLLAGYVIPDQSSPPLACIIRDLSSSGARLELERINRAKPVMADALPREVILFVSPSRSEAKCRISWRDGSHLGVNFLTPLQKSRREAS